MSSTAQPVKKIPAEQTTAYNVLFIIGVCHLLNDSLQAVVPAMFPIIGETMSLSYTQLGMIAFALNIISSIMQPAVGWYTDKRPLPFALPIGLTSSLAGMVLLALAPNYYVVILSVILIGIGSAVFHPEGSRVAFMAGGPKRGLSQSIYQVGGNTGQALAPLITAIVLVPFGQKGALWFAPVAFTAVLLLMYIARWYSGQLIHFQPKKTNKKTGAKSTIGKKIGIALFLILFIIFARSWYVACITNFYAFYLIGEYSFTIKTAQFFIFAFLAAGALGTFVGGPLADRFGRKKVILFSLAGSAPITILVPFASSSATFILLMISGFIIMTSFSVTVVYAQELVPGKVGTMAGLTVGLAFGMGAVGSVALGSIADSIGISSMIKMVGFLPLLGMIGFFLPSDETLKNWYPKEV
ncbi:MFS transporter [Bacillus sp. CECT 9360]|uniref:MFS transporter n=1 Tax=Bacillus sp. CECT 9360 TaxID=2845821 RepID=UPI001E2A0443|nr:MFS transporter [Bacillus sp. CECT 9360]CAH0345869.1 Fosmidomycin resistance protein [Bacillus sp. CECT 9360]